MGQGILMSGGADIDFYDTRYFFVSVLRADSLDYDNACLCFDCYAGNHWILPGGEQSG